jgi:hypothetical protein
MDTMLSSILTLEEYIGQFHAIFSYVTLAFFLAAFIADLLNYFGRTKALAFGHWFIILGVLSCIPTLFTGIAAEESFTTTNFFLEKHISLGYTTAISASFYAGLRISAMLWSLPLKPLHYVFLSLLMVALVFWTLDYGWLIKLSQQ